MKEKTRITKTDPEYVEMLIKSRDGFQARCERYNAAFKTIAKDESLGNRTSAALARQMLAS